MNGAFHLAISTTGRDAGTMSDFSDFRTSRDLAQAIVTFPVTLFVSSSLADRVFAPSPPSRALKAAVCPQKAHEQVQLFQRVASNQS